MSSLVHYFRVYHWSYILAIFTLSVYATVALVAPILSNQHPLCCRTADGNIYPAISNTDRNLYLQYPSDEKTCIMALIPFSPQVTDIKHSAAKSPGFAARSGEAKHWLGTDKLGRDVTSGLIYGTKTAMQIGFISVLFSFIIGVSLGMVAGYQQGEGWSVNLWQILGFVISTFLLSFYTVFEWTFDDLSLFQWLLYIAIFILFHWSIYHLTKDLSSFKKYKIDPDTILVKAIEIRKSFPGIFILLALTSLFVLPSVWNIIFIITLLGWTEFARFARAETLAVKNENYITAAKVLGFGHFRIIFRHILPNILSSLVVIACFSVGSAIILESTLSFLGIGLPVEQVTWGKMMAEGRDMQLWWLVLFPGLALFIIILCLNTIADVWSGKDGGK